MDCFKNALVFCCLISMAQACQFDFKVAGFVPNSSLFRTIYGTIMPAYQAEFSSNMCTYIKYWSNITWIHKSGKSCPLRCATKLNVLLASVGLAYPYCIHEGLETFWGAGFCYSWLQEKNHTTVCNTTHRPGGIFKWGLTQQYKSCALTIFADYLVQDFCVKHALQRTSVNCKGLFLGIGIGVFF